MDGGDEIRLRYRPPLALEIEITGIDENVVNTG